MSLEEEAASQREGRGRDFYSGELGPVQGSTHKEGPLSVISRGLLKNQQQQFRWER